MSGFRAPSPGVVRCLCAAAVAACGAAAALAQGSLAANSPFLPSAGSAAAAAAAAQGEPYELAGSSVQGSDVSVCIYERQAKRSQWIPVGGLVDGIRVISFDAAHDRAVVAISGAYRELSLRKSAVAPAGPPAPVRAAPVALEAAPPPPAPAAPPAPPAPGSALHEQQEARMLVSDLLEIGVQQRKAYQEARQKAAVEAAGQPTK